MKTSEAVDRFLKKCEDRGLSPESIRTYRNALDKFAGDFPELPTDTPRIEQYLKKYKETPAHRGPHFKRIQAFYSYLAYEEDIESPVPSKGKVGRPRKLKLVPVQPQATLDEIGVAENVKLVNTGQPVPVSASIPTHKAVERFLIDRKDREFKDGTFKVYYGVFTPFVRQFPVLPLDMTDVQKFIASIQVKPPTKWKYRTVLRALYRFLEKKKLIPQDTWDLVVGSPPKGRRTVLTEAQIKKLFTLPMSPSDRILLELIMFIGLRSNAICNLRREDIYDGYIHLEDKKGRYDLPIPSDLEAKLLMLAPSGLLFRSPKGPLKTNYLYKKIRHWQEAVGVEEGKRGPHRLRHSYAVRYLRKGGDLQSLSQVLGHKNISTTQIYADMAREDLRGQLERVNPLEGLTSKDDLVRAICRSCNKQLVLEKSQVMITKCPDCGVTGSWYLPDVGPGRSEEHKFPDEEVERLAAMWGPEEGESEAP